MNDNETQRENLVKLFKWGGLAGALVLVVPFLFFLALMAAGTVTAIAIAAVGGIALVNFLPVFSMKMTNWRLKAMKAEARANPIETAQHEIILLNKELDDFKQQTKERLAQGNALIEDVKIMMEEDPEGAAAFEPDIIRFHQEMELREESLKDRIEILAEATARVKRAAKRWDMAQKHAAIRKPSDADKAMRKIILEEALDTVMVAAHKNSADMTVENMTSRINRDIAERKTQGAAASQPLSLENLKPYTISADILTVSVNQKVIAQ